MYTISHYDCCISLKFNMLLSMNFCMKTVELSQKHYDMNSPGPFKPQHADRLHSLLHAHVAIDQQPKLNKIDRYLIVFEIIILKRWIPARSIFSTLCLLSRDHHKQLLKESYLKQLFKTFPATTGNVIDTNAYEINHWPIRNKNQMKYTLGQNKKNINDNFRYDDSACVQYFRMKNYIIDKWYVLT